MIANGSLVPAVKWSGLPAVKWTQKVPAAGVNSLPALPSFLGCLSGVHLLMVCLASLPDFGSVPQSLPRERASVMLPSS